MDRRVFVASLVALLAALKALSEPNVVKDRKLDAQRLHETMDRFDECLRQFSLEHGQGIIDAVSGGMR